ncbi:Usherin [Cricetulus griseus]|uniref:Usherin n=1 Tax=Cricetulus griseus TaxID=10029 RepID=G3GRF4_CRIGR|nr:Usherin [Cricetulus griseus]
MSLTNREILELFSGDLPPLHIQPHCRCPGSHPRVHPLAQQYCIPNGPEDKHHHQVSRLNPEAHPLSFINDGDIATSWVSHVFANLTQLSQGVIVSVDLENEQYQCDRCLPLYNDKPFRSGDGVHPFNCKPCQCNNHARSCHYDASVDPFPLEHSRGGGGVCDNCQHHTTGRNCESCQDYFYRPIGADPSALDVCKPCDCNRAGTRNGDLLCDPIGGQCDCKRHVSGRQCLRCQDGFYDLQALDPDGCRPCNCNPSGTVDGDITCHQNSGQCLCKANVIGLRCNRCNFGFKFLQSFNDDGCQPCQCNPHGSVNQLCNPLSGQCECKKEAKGLKCDTCREDFYGLAGSACKACDCSLAGSQAGTTCDAETGQCVCKSNVGGRQCNQCLEGYFSLQQKDSFLCLPCNCEKTGTVHGSLLCDKSTGQCLCKSGVTGLRCDQCAPHRFNLTMGNLQGCQVCECDSLGTLPGSICDPVSGQCPCLPHRQGRRCEQCQPGFYTSPGHATGCLPCLCHTVGAMSHICNGVTGQCRCRDPSTTGQSCYQCQDGYFRFDPETGRCQPCHCHLAGALNETCDVVTGQCFCKQFVTGSKCDMCVPGASHLDANNLLGCSKSIKASFQTRMPEGLIVLAVSPDSQEEYFALQLKNGRPYFLSNPQLNVVVALSSNLEKITQRGFVGCIKDVSIMKSYSPSLMWMPLDWQSSEEQVNTYHSWEGCPSVLEEGAQFLGAGFLELPSDTFHAAKDFEISLKFQTNQLNGLLLFIHNKEGPDFLAMELKSGLLSFQLKSSLLFTQVDLWLGLAYCDGSWNTVIIKKEGSMVSVAVNELMEHSSQAGAQTLQVNSPVYVGGIPQELQDSYSHLTLEKGFRGCMKEVAFTRGTVVNLASVSSRAVRVHQEGCLSSDRTVNCGGNDSILVYWGSQQSVYESGLQPFTAPQSVPTPLRAQSINGYSIEVAWDEPTVVKGVPEKYFLKAYSEDSPQPHIPSASVELDNTSTLEDLGVFTAYEFILGACTYVGCTNSSRVILQTAQLPPEQVDPPTLAVVDSRTIHIQWKQPRQLNGILEHYILYSLNPTRNSSVWNVIYNNTKNDQAYTLRHLSPGCLYLIKLGACTGGGCAMSEPSQALTEETVPEGVPAPQAHSYSPDSFNISWTEPEYPNGVITAYGLYLDDTLIHNSSELSCHACGFDPGSLHTFRVQACTAKGCALGPLVENWTLEVPPEGMVNVLVKAQGSREAHVTWEAPLHPNGHLTYSVLFTGSFYANQGDNYTLLSGTKTIHSSAGNRLWVLVDGLVPCSHYTVQVNASNSRGTVLSDPVSVEMPPAAPDGLLSPRLASATPTSLQVVWSTPARNNAPGSPTYQLQMRPGPSTHGILELFPNPSASLSYEVSGLQPFTVYEFRLVATNGFGSTRSAWTPLMTAEDKPGPIDAPVVVNVKSTMLSVVWQQPAKCNGVITHYNIHQQGHLYFTASGNVTSCTVAHLHPHTAYRFQVEACTSKGCSKSPESQTVWTLPGTAEDIPIPELFPYTPTSVIVSWQPPTSPNGLVENFTIERRVKGREEVRSLATLPRSHGIKFIDEDPALRPWTQYEYRVLGNTLNGGTRSSTWVEVATRPSRPAGVPQPGVHVLGPDAVKVTWKAPLTQNGDILSYEIRMPDPLVTITNVTSMVLSHLIKHLIPFTNYSVTIVACSGGNGYLGGCTESLPTSVTTLPALPEELAPLSAIPLSESYVEISWQPPSKPNGPNLR